MENKPDLLIADGGELPLAQRGNVGPFQEIAAARGRIQTAQNIHEGRFAAAAGAHYRYEFTAGDFQAHAPQGVHAGIAQLVIFVDVFDHNGNVGSAGLTDGFRL